MLANSLASIVRCLCIVTRLSIPMYVLLKVHIRIVICIVEFCIVTFLKKRKKKSTTVEVPTLQLMQHSIVITHNTSNTVAGQP